MLRVAEQKHNNILDKFYEIWNNVIDLIERNFDVAVIRYD